MAFAFVQRAQVAAGTGADVTTPVVGGAGGYTVVTTVGNQVLVCAGTVNNVANGSQQVISSITDDGSNTYTLVLTQDYHDANWNCRLTVWTGPQLAAAGRLTAHYATHPATNSFGAIVACEYSGLLSGASIVDVSSSAGATSDSTGVLDSGTTAGAAAAGELFMGFAGDMGNAGAFGSFPANYTTRAGTDPSGNMGVHASEYTGVVASGTTNHFAFAAGSNSTQGCICIAFKVPGTPAGGGGSSANYGSSDEFEDLGPAFFDMIGFRPGQLPSAKSA